MLSAHYQRPVMTINGLRTPGDAQEAGSSPGCSKPCRKTGSTASSPDAAAGPELHLTPGRIGLYPASFSRTRDRNSSRRSRSATRRPATC